MTSVLSRLAPLALLATLALAGNSSAQATRTWVSGVGDDANPCSRTAPCKTFAGAISKTAPFGIINAIDSGGFGAVTITKSITIQADPTLGGVLSSGTYGVIVNAASTDQVILRGLTIDGIGSGTYGVRFLGGLSLTIENCQINRFVNGAVDFEPVAGMNSSLFVTDTVIRNNNFGTSGGILIKPAIGATAVASIDNARIERNTYGVRIEAGGSATISRSVISRSSGGDAGVHVIGAASANLTESVITMGLGTAVISDGTGATVRLDRTSISGNSVGLSAVASGEILSFGNNAISDSGATTGAILLK